MHVPQAYLPAEVHAEFNIWTLTTFDRFSTRVTIIYQGRVVYRRLRRLAIFVYSDRRVTGNFKT
jgi:hypothetical protein